jgi:predicted metal-dependent phosphoesterase TrpH
VRRAAVAVVVAGWLGAASAAQAPPRWYRGNLHTHTINSDGDSPPYDVVAWYKRNGYQFLVITDHNTFTDPALFDTNPVDNFLLIGGEEITNDKVVHVNAIGIRRVIPKQTGDTATALLQTSIDAVREQGGIPLINHPNFHWAFTAAEMKPLKGTGLLEIASGHPLVNHAGDGKVPSTEQMWDELLTAGVRIFGAAVDDAHNFREEFTPERANPGRAWVAVRAPTLTWDAIVAAFNAGDFYASTGVQLRDVRHDAGSLVVELPPPAGGRRYRIDFIGAGGRVLNTSYDNPARYSFTGAETYVRARIEESNGLRAWTQPVFVKK